VNSINETLREHHGVAHRSHFLTTGETGYSIGKARHCGEIVRVRRAWYAEPNANPDVVLAVRVGGALSCRSALALAGVWVADDPAVHVGVAQNASRLRSAGSAKVSFADDPSGATIHWTPWPGEIRRSVDSIALALAHYSTCQAPEMALVAIDCCLNRKLVKLAELRRVFRYFPRKSVRLLDLANPQSQSGLETLARYRLRSRGIHVRTQVEIDGVGHVDVVIGERLVLELDGYGFHATGEFFETDRRRDLALMEMGYRVLRLSYRQVMSEWSIAERVILALVRRREHRWPRRSAPFSG
jgi:very-short-patch-repair endonuclease